MRRAREQHAGMTLKEAVAEIGKHHLTSEATISRMENSDDVPRDPRRRALACVAALVYGLDPTQFGVGSDDLPPGTVLDLNATRAQVMSLTKWYAANVVQLPRAS